jgi:hypothetical protein
VRRLRLCNRSATDDGFFAPNEGEQTCHQFVFTLSKQREVYLLTQLLTEL